MPRKSSASGDVLQVFVPGQRPAPPEDLTPEQASEWVKIVGALPPTWISAEMFPLLIELSRLIVYSRELATWLNENKIGSLKGSTTKHRYIMGAYLGTQKAISSLSVKLRLSPQSRYLPRAAESETRNQRISATRKGQRPWEIKFTERDDTDEAPERN